MRTINMQRLFLVAAIFAAIASPILAGPIRNFIGNRMAARECRGAPVFFPHLRNAACSARVASNDGEVGVFRLVRPLESAESVHRHAGTSSTTRTGTDAAGLTGHYVRKCYDRDGNGIVDFCREEFVADGAANASANTSEDVGVSGILQNVRDRRHKRDGDLATMIEAHPDLANVPGSRGALRKLASLDDAQQAKAVERFNAQNGTRLETVRQVLQYLIDNQDKIMSLVQLIITIVAMF